MDRILLAVYDHPSGQLIPSNKKPRISCVAFKVQQPSRPTLEACMCAPHVMTCREYTFAPHHCAQSLRLLESTSPCNTGHAINEGPYLDNQITGLDHGEASAAIRPNQPFKWQAAYHLISPCNHLISPCNHATTGSMQCMRDRPSMCASTFTSQECTHTCTVTTCMFICQHHQLQVVAERNL